MAVVSNNVPPLRSGQTYLDNLIAKKCRRTLLHLAYDNLRYATGGRSTTESSLPPDGGNVLNESTNNLKNSEDDGSKVASDATAKAERNDNDNKEESKMSSLPNIPRAKGQASKGNGEKLAPVAEVSPCWACKLNQMKREQLDQVDWPAMLAEELEGKAMVHTCGRDTGVLGSLMTTQQFKTPAVNSSSLSNEDQSATTDYRQNDEWALLEVEIDDHEHFAIHQDHLAAPNDNHPVESLDEVIKQAKQLSRPDSGVGAAKEDEADLNADRDEADLSADRDERSETALLADEKDDAPLKSSNVTEFGDGVFSDDEDIVGDTKQMPPHKLSIDDNESVPEPPTVPKVKLLSEDYPRQGSLDSSDEEEVRLGTEPAKLDSDSDQELNNVARRLSHIGPI